MQEAENQIVVAYDSYDRGGPATLGRCLGAIETHLSTLGCTPPPGGGRMRLLLGQERGGLRNQGVKRRLHPNRSTKSPERKREQRTGCSARPEMAGPAASRSQQRGQTTALDWGSQPVQGGYRYQSALVGLGVIADNLRQIQPRHGQAVSGR